MKCEITQIEIGDATMGHLIAAQVLAKLDGKDRRINVWFNPTNNEIERSNFLPLDQTIFAGRRHMQQLREGQLRTLGISFRVAMEQFATRSAKVDIVTDHRPALAAKARLKQIEHEKNGRLYAVSEDADKLLLLLAAMLDAYPKSELSARRAADDLVKKHAAALDDLRGPVPEYCTYPKCKCIVSTSTSQPEPICPLALQKAGG